MQLGDFGGQHDGVLDRFVVAGGDGGIFFDEGDALAIGEGQLDDRLHGAAEHLIADDLGKLDDAVTRRERGGWGGRPGRRTSRKRAGRKGFRDGQ